MKVLIDKINFLLSSSQRHIVNTVEKEFHDYLKISNPSFSTLPLSKDLKFLFHLYDYFYFSELMSKHIKISLTYSNRLTKSAGLVKYSLYTQKAEIIFSIPLIFIAYLNDSTGHQVNGVFCKTPVEALMRVMEHELTHLIEYVLFKKSSCSNPQFLKICYNLFGHTESKHMIGINSESNRVKYSFKKGETVSFLFNGTKYHGILNRITKRATVIVNDNNSIRKFYVPVNLLKRIQKENL